MPIAQKIQFLKRTQINDAKWNTCVSNAPNGILYSYTWYLDCFAENWFGLVYEDYEMVMAFPCKSKMGIHYIYLPPLLPHLGLMGNNINNSIFNLFLNAIPPKYRLIDIVVHNQENVLLPESVITPVINYCLGLNKPYEVLRKEYNDNTLRNIKKKSAEGELILLDNPMKVIEMAKVQFSHFDKKVLLALDKFAALNLTCPVENRCKNYAYISKDKKLLAAASIMFSHQRMYYLVATSTREAKVLGAAHKLVDAIIHNFADTDTLIDFEGSAIEGIAFFYAGFGAKADHYQRIYINTLSPIIKFITAK
jgi:hypothetical protein